MDSPFKNVTLESQEEQIMLSDLSGLYWAEQQGLEEIAGGRLTSTFTGGGHGGDLQNTEDKQIK